MPAISAKVSWRPTLRQRLSAWWEGYELQPPPTQARAANDQRAKLAAVPQPKEPTHSVERLSEWEQGRIVFNEEVWGEDFLLPGGKDYFLEFVAPLELGPSSNILDLTAGIGGGPRALHAEFKAWVEGYERDPVLAAEGAARSERAELGTTASVKQHDPLGGTVPKGDYDCVIARDLFYLVPDKRKLLANIHRILRAPGQLSFTDYVVGDRNQKLDFEEWKMGEPGAPAPVMLDDWQELLQEIGFKLRAAEDISDRYAELILDGWREAYAKFASGRIPREGLPWLHDEAHFWAARSKAIQSGAIRVVRLHVIKKAPSNL